MGKLGILNGNVDIDHEPHQQAPRRALSSESALYTDSIIGEVAGFSALR
jgi:hypothetical protein